MNIIDQFKTSILVASLVGLTACSQNPVAPEPSAATDAPTGAEPAAPAASAATAPVKPDGLSGTSMDANASGRSAGGLDQGSQTLPSIGAPEQRSVYFDYDRFDIRDEAKGLLINHGKFMTSRPDAKMLIQGHADERGSREYNLALGQRRADAVKRALLAQGIKEEAVESVSLGEEKPKATGHDEASWAENRRADMLYKGEY